MKILCCLMSYEITKGMKSRGPIGLLKKNNNSEELIVKQIDSIKKLFIDNHICVVSGFGADKIQKKLPSDVAVIVNDKYNNSNQVYAFKLFLQNVPNLHEYSGIFIANSDIIIKKTFSADYTKSWIVTKPKNNRNKREDLLGVNLDNEQKLNIIFYDVGNTVWCNAIYLCRDDVLSIKSTINQYYDNMFLFEMINKSINNHNLIITQHQLPKSSDCIVIKGPKDRHKII